MGQEIFSLDGKVALVTGGNGGLGRAMARGLQAAGADIAVTGRNPEKNDRIAEELGPEAAVFELDVTDEEGLVHTVAAVRERFGRFDILVNNAGTFRGGSVLELDRADWDAVLASHLTGTFLCSKHAARSMIDAGHGGKIVNIGSMYSIFGPPQHPDYAAAKTGIAGLTRALAVELAAHNIQVNALLPGWYDTDLTGGARETEWGERIRAKTPAARWGEHDDLVGPVVFLASEASDFVTGCLLPVDGGYSIADRLLPE